MTLSIKKTKISFIVMLNDDIRLYTCFNHHEANLAIEWLKAGMPLDDKFKEAANKYWLDNVDALIKRLRNK